MNIYQLVILAGVIGFVCGAPFGAFVMAILKASKFEPPRVQIADPALFDQSREVFDRYRDNRVKVPHAH